MFGKKWNPQSNSPLGLRFKLSTLFVAVLILAIGLTIYLPFLKAQQQRRAKLQLFLRIRSPNLIGHPISDFPEVANLANNVIDESHPDAKSHMEDLKNVQATMGEKFGMKDQAQTGLKIYWFKFEEPLTEGEPCEFAVITHDGMIVYVNDITPIW